MLTLDIDVDEFDFLGVNKFLAEMGTHSAEAFKVLISEWGPAGAQTECIGGPSPKAIKDFKDNLAIESANEILVAAGLPKYSYPASTAAESAKAPEIPSRIQGLLSNLVALCKENKYDSLIYDGPKIQPQNPSAEKQPHSDVETIEGIAQSCRIFFNDLFPRGVNSEAKFWICRTKGETDSPGSNQAFLPNPGEWGIHPQLIGVRLDEELVSYFMGQAQMNFIQAQNADPNSDKDRVMYVYADAHNTSNFGDQPSFVQLTLMGADVEKLFRAHMNLTEPGKDLHQARYGFQAAYWGGLDNDYVDAAQVVVSGDVFWLSSYLSEDLIESKPMSLSRILQAWREGEQHAFLGDLDPKLAHECILHTEMDRFMRETGIFSAEMIVHQDGALEITTVELYADDDSRRRGPQGEESHSEVLQERAEIVQKEFSLEIESGVYVWDVGDDQMLRVAEVDEASQTPAAPG